MSFISNYSLLPPANSGRELNLIGAGAIEAQVFLLPDPINKLEVIELPELIDVEGEKNSDNYTYTFKNRKWVGWTPEQTQLITELALSGKKLNYADVVERVNSLVEDDTLKRTRRGCVAKCNLIRKHHLKNPVVSQSEHSKPMEIMLHESDKKITFRANVKWTERQTEIVTNFVKENLNKKLNFDVICSLVNSGIENEKNQHSPAACMAKFYAIRAQLHASSI